MVEDDSHDVNVLELAELDEEVVGATRHEQAELTRLGLP